MDYAKYDLMWMLRHFCCQRFDEVKVPVDSTALQFRFVLLSGKSTYIIQIFASPTLLPACR